MNTNEHELTAAGRARQSPARRLECDKPKAICKNCSAKYRRTILWRLIEFRSGAHGVTRPTTPGRSWFGFCKSVTTRFFEDSKLRTGVWRNL
jgi:hypothetical protein